MKTVPLVALPPEAHGTQALPADLPKPNTEGFPTWQREAIRDAGHATLVSLAANGMAVLAIFLIWAVIFTR